jgi:hypothetical protein
MADYRHVLVASHPRSGTHLTIDTLRVNLEALADDYVNVDRMLPGHSTRLAPEDFRSLLDGHQKPQVIKTHATPDLAAFAFDPTALEIAGKVKRNSRLVYVYRDGRDVLTSSYHFDKFRAPDLPDRTFGEFLRSPSLMVPVNWPPEMTPLECWVRHVSEWLEVEGCLTVSYEELVRDPDAALRKLAAFLGLPPPPAVKPIKFHRPSLPARIYRRLTRRQFTSSAVKPRKGVVGDWVNHFTKDDEALFWEHAGPVMRRLGYT